MVEPSIVEELEHRIVQLYESRDRMWSCLLGFYQSTIPEGPGSTFKVSRDEHGECEDGKQ